MNDIFLDTVGLLALWNERDQWHPSAVLSFRRLQEAHIKIYSTELVFAECANAAARTRFRSSVADMRKTMLFAGGILQPTDLELAGAWMQYRQDLPGQPGIVDLISFAVMRRFNISSVFSNDRHFKSAGFTTLF